MKLLNCGTNCIANTGYFVTTVLLFCLNYTTAFGLLVKLRVSLNGKKGNRQGIELAVSAIRQRLAKFTLKYKLSSIHFRSVFWKPPPGIPQSSAMQWPAVAITQTLLRFGDTKFRHK